MTERSALRTLVPVLCAVALLFPIGCSPEEPPPSPVLSPLVLGVSKETMSALAYVARDGGLFAAQGLDVTFKEYESGQQVFEAVMSGEIDVGQCADTPIVLGALENKNVTVFATVATDMSDIKVIARKDAGITNPADVRGKRIGTREGTAAEFFLHLFLIKYGMSEDDVEMRYATFDEVTQALIAREIDAVALRQPFTSELQRVLGADYVLMEEPGLYEKTMNLCAVTDNPAVTTDVQVRLVRAMIDAEAAAVRDGDAARSRVADRLGLRPEDICDCILIEGAVTLRQSLILTLEDQARWALEQSGSDASPPNFFTVIDTTALEAVAPERVTVIK
jgi:NitT/TauT family transport system substrate-binding protein